MRGRSIHCPAATRRYAGCTTGFEPAVALSAARFCCAGDSFGTTDGYRGDMFVSSSNVRGTHRQSVYMCLIASCGLPGPGSMYQSRRACSSAVHSMHGGCSAGVSHSVVGGVKVRCGWRSRMLRPCPAAPYAPHAHGTCFLMWRPPSARQPTAVSSTTVSVASRAGSRRPGSPNPLRVDVRGCQSRLGDRNDTGPRQSTQRLRREHGYNFLL